MLIKEPERMADVEALMTVEGETHSVNPIGGALDQLSESAGVILGACDRERSISVDKVILRVDEQKG
jgi:hypothetical protein